MVLVVQERPDDLFLHHFWIVTNLDARRVSAEEVLALYRRRGKAEAHMGELKSVLGVPLSSTDRGKSTVEQVMARNEVNLLLSLYAYQSMHALRCLMEDVTQDGWSLCRLREQVLKVAAVAVIHARQVSIRLGVAAQRWWGAPTVRIVGTLALLESEPKAGGEERFHEVPRGAQRSCPEEAPATDRKSVV